MEEITNNSDKAKTQIEVVSKPNLSSEVKPVRKSGARKFLELFIKEDIENVGKYIVEKVVIPNLQTLAHDALDKGIYALFHGINDTPAPKPASNQERSSIYTQWDKNATPVVPQSMRPAPTGYTFREYDLATRGDAEIVIDWLEKILENEKKVSIGHYYDMISKGPSQTDWNFGWKDLTGIKAVQNSNGRWEIKFPPIKYIGG